MFSNVPFRRELDVADLERMRIPKRYWHARFDETTDDGGSESLRSMLGKYIDNMETMRAEGAGFIFYGANGTGKTCASVVLSKEFRRRGNTVLFMEAANLKRQVLDREMFDEDSTYWDRACEVDVLVIDDFGKGIMDSTGFGASLFDELLRARNAQKLVTIITTNADVSEWRSMFELKESTLQTLKECMIPLHVTGENKREGSVVKLKAILASS